MSASTEEIRGLAPEEITLLKEQRCTASDWKTILISTELDLTKIVNVRFTGPVVIHKGAILTNIPGGISGYIIKENASIENVASIIYDEDTNFGVGVEVSVLDETGSRKVIIYPGMSAQIATLMAREKDWMSKLNNGELQAFLDSRTPTAEIGENVKIRDCGQIRNVSVGKEVIINGASRLYNGCIINNATEGHCFSYVGNSVEAENFIFEDAKVDSGSHVTNCYVGQGVEMSHGFSAHDCLFFANCSMENGEAHSLLAGPYSVSMHKGTLLIGCQTSFLNAGSLTNQSNHMYKLGPLHWGVLERGVKTSSSSHLMLGARIGAFSLLMGAHKTHPDSSEFPFSYLFGDERGGTIVVPAMMLKSCGLLRDEQKWPARDRRLNKGLPLFDRINFNVLNPFTVDTMLKALELIDRLFSIPTDDLYVRYKGMKFTRSSLERAKNLYTNAIFKYLSNTLPDLKFPPRKEGQPIKWMDLCGQIMPRDYLNKALECNDIISAEECFNEAYVNYQELESEWISQRFGEWWRQREDSINEYAKKFDELIEEDRQQYLQILDEEAEMLSL